MIPWQARKSLRRKGNVFKSKCKREQERENESIIVVWSFLYLLFFFNQINIFRKTAPAMELKQNDDSYKSVWNAQAEGKCLRDAYSNV